MFRIGRSVTMVVRMAPGVFPTTARNLSLLSTHRIDASSALGKRLSRLLSHRSSFRLLSTRKDGGAETVGGADEELKPPDASAEQQKTLVNQRFDEDGYYEETEGKGSTVKLSVTCIYKYGILVFICLGTKASAIAFLSLGLGFFALAVYYLWPSKMGANSVFSSAFEVVRINDEVRAVPIVCVCVIDKLLLRSWVSRETP